MSTGLETSVSSATYRGQHRWKLIAPAFCAIVFVLIGGVYAFRFELWRGRPEMRWIVRPLLLADPTLRRLDKAGVGRLLGEPNAAEGRYCWFPRDLHQMSGDLRFEIDSSNQVARVRFIWRDWKPTKVMPMNLGSWKDQTETDRWAMNADLVHRWPEGNFNGKLQTVNDVLKHFPSVRFIDLWQYASDGGHGLGGSLDFQFEPDGGIRKVRSGYID